MIKQNLLLILASMAGVGAVLYFVWVCLRDSYHFVVDWRQSRKIGDLRTQRKVREAALREENARRLDNGCDHEFDTLFGAFPPDVCCRCGLSRQKPPGDCDHVWRREKGLIPASRCEKCGKKHGGALAEQNAANQQQGAR
jgi:hypothetical protein